MNLAWVEVIASTGASSFRKESRLIWAVIPSSGLLNSKCFKIESFRVEAIASTGASLHIMKWRLIWALIPWSGAFGSKFF